MMLAESYYPKRSWNSPRVYRIGFHGLIAVINTVIMRLPTLFIVIPALMIINEYQDDVLNESARKNSQYDLFYATNKMLSPTEVGLSNL